VGYTRSHLGQYEEAIGRHTSALELATTAGFRRGEVEAMIGLAIAYRGLGRPDDALHSAEAALEAAEAAGFHSFAAHTLTVLAEIHFDRQEPDQALEYVRRALAIHEQTGHRLGHARAHRAAGAIRQHESPDAARRHWREAYELFMDLGTPEADALRTLLDAAG
jgi:tetratricopeptide (TPR) repeat protein